MWTRLQGKQLEKTLTERTKQWLAAAFISLVLKVFFMDPMKVAAMACFVQYAEGLDSEIMQRLADVARNVDAN